MMKMILAGALVLGWGLFWGTPALAQHLESVDEVADDKTPASLQIEARQGASGRWGRGAAVWSPQPEALSLRVRPIEGATVRWFLIFAEIDQPYKNANHPWEPDAYKWVGFQPIRYHRLELEELRGAWEIQPFAAGRTYWDRVQRAFASRGQRFDARFNQERAGTWRFQAIAQKGSKRWRTPGLEDIEDRGISRRVMKVSILDREGFTGYLRSYLNVPGIFGSVSHQSNHHIGVDCADLLVAAHGHWRRRPTSRNYNVSMLVAEWPHAAEADLSAGVPDAPLAWGTQIKPGDFIAVRYEGRTRYQHIGALMEDTDGDGVLSAGDTVFHAGPYPPHESLLSEGAFDGHVVILRPR